MSSEHSSTRPRRRSGTSVPSSPRQSRRRGSDGLGHSPLARVQPKGRKGDLCFGVYFHCGGFVMGGIEADDYICRVIAMSTPCVIVSVVYRLAPEHKYLAAHDDAKTAYKWACENISKYGASPSRGFVLGQSAGATLAISTALSSSQLPHYRVNGVVTIGPVTCAPPAVPSHLAEKFKREENADSAIIDNAALDVYLAAYDPPRDDPTYSVLLSPDLSSLSPTYLVATGKDPLRDDVLVFEKAARDAGVRTHLDFYEGFPHLFWIVPGLKKGEVAVGNIVKGVKWVIANF
ncbi:lipase/esteras-like protein [Coniochaeta sp. 2T2.1]|nr:lipase/esteras-like protein [Coniochaeta sp. 2T2.1]